MEYEKCVYRQFALPVSAFDHLKEFQRGYEQLHNVTITNAQTLTIILEQHKKHIEESEEQHDAEVSKT